MRGKLSIVLAVATFWVVAAVVPCSAQHCKVIFDGQPTSVELSGEQTTPLTDRVVNADQNEVLTNHERRICGLEKNAGGEAATEESSMVTLPQLLIGLVVLAGLGLAIWAIVTANTRGGNNGGNSQINTLATTANTGGQQLPAGATRCRVSGTTGDGGSYMLSYDIDAAAAQAAANNGQPAVVNNVAGGAGGNAGANAPVAAAAAAANPLAGMIYEAAAQAAMVRAGWAQAPTLAQVQYLGAVLERDGVNPSDARAVDAALAAEQAAGRI